AVPVLPLGFRLISNTTCPEAFAQWSERQLPVRRPSEALIEPIASVQFCRICRGENCSCRCAASLGGKLLAPGRRHRRISEGTRGAIIASRWKIETAAPREAAISEFCSEAMNQATAGAVAAASLRSFIAA